MFLTLMKTLKTRNKNISVQLRIREISQEFTIGVTVCVSFSPLLAV